jgi:hypothetical protein
MLVKFPNMKYSIIKICLMALKLIHLSMVKIIGTFLQLLTVDTPNRRHKFKLNKVVV